MGGYKHRFDSTFDVSRSELQIVELIVYLQPIFHALSGLRYLDAVTVFKLLIIINARSNSFLLTFTTFYSA